MTASRYHVVQALLALRDAVAEFSCIVAVMALGFAFADMWPVAPEVATALAVFSAVLLQRRARKAEQHWMETYEPGK